MDHNVRGNVQKNKSKFKDIIQIKVDHLPSYPIFDKSFFDKFSLGSAPTLPTEFSVTKATLQSHMSVCPSVCHRNPSASQNPVYLLLSLHLDL